MTRPFQYSQLPFNHQIITLAPQDIGPFIWPQNTWISSSAPRSIQSYPRITTSKPPTCMSHYIPERSVIERALQMTGTYHPPPVSSAPLANHRRSWSPRPRAVGSSYRSPSVDSVEMDDSPGIPTPRDLSEVPVAVYGQDDPDVKPFEQGGSPCYPSNTSPWDRPPSPEIKYAPLRDRKVSTTVKPKSLKKRTSKPDPPRRTSARLFKNKAAATASQEPGSKSQQPVVDPRVISMEACFGETVSLSCIKEDSCRADVYAQSRQSEYFHPNVDEQNAADTSLNIDLDVTTNRPRQSSRAAAKTAHQLIEEALRESPTCSPERDDFANTPAPSSLPPELLDADFPSTHIYQDGTRRPKVQKLPNPVPDHNLTKSARGRAVPSDPSQIRSKTVHVCPIPSCGACFARREHVKRHVRGLHTEEKPYKCLSDGCGKSFSRRDNLGLHYTNLHKMSKVKMQEMLGLLDTVLPATL